MQRLQAMQHSHFWKQQHRTLFTALNGTLEPILQSVCADALDTIRSLSLAEHGGGGVRGGQPTRGGGTSATSIKFAAAAVQTQATAQAAARLQAAIQSLLPAGTRTEVMQHALTELLPLVDPAGTCTKSELPPRKGTHVPCTPCLVSTLPLRTPRSQALP